MAMQVFFKMRLHPATNGACISTEKFYSVHETPKMHFCIHEMDKWQLSTHSEESFWDQVKRQKIKVKRIYKTGSRVAFATEEEAWKHLLMLKHKQRAHLRRDLKFLDVFLSVVDLSKTPEFDHSGFTTITTPELERIMSGLYIFD